MAPANNNGDKNMAAATTGKHEPATTATMTQVTALYLTQRSLLQVLCIPIILLLAVPLSGMVLCAVLDPITHRHTVPTVLATTGLVVGVRHWIFQMAPSPAKATQAMQTTFVQFVLPTISLMVSIGLVRTFLGSQDHLGQWSPTVPWMPCLCLAMGSFWLGLTVIVRYVGPSSVVRCSTSPLFVNPSNLRLHKIITSFSIGNTLLDVLEKVFWWRKRVMVTTTSSKSNNKQSQSQATTTTKPAPNQGGMMSPESIRRLQMPTIKTAFVQFAFAIISSVLMGMTALIPFSSLESSSGGTLVLTCVLVSLIALAQSTLPISNLSLHHELNPLRYSAGRIFSHRRHYPSLVSHFLFADAINLLIWPAIVTIMIAFAFGWSDFMLCLLTSYVETLFLAGFDFVLRVKLCTTPLNMRSVVATAADGDSMDVLLNVTLTSILHSNDDLVVEVSRMSDFTAKGLAAEEHTYHQKETRTMARTLLCKTRADELAPHLEDDILRFAMLRSLHFKFDSWIEPPQQNTVMRDVQMSKAQESVPYSVPLVRALCVYVGGLGEALVHCSKDNETWNQEWLIPPGAIQCAAHGLSAIAACMIWNFDNAQSTTISWSSNHMAFLVGSRVLTSAWKLQSGIVCYAQSSGRVKPSETETELAKRDIVRDYCPHLLALYDAAADSALKVLEKIASMDLVGSRGLHVNTFDVECQHWTQGLLAKLAGGTA